MFDSSVTSTNTNVEGVTEKKLSDFYNRDLVFVQPSELPF